MPQNELMRKARTPGTMLVHRQHGTCLVQDPIEQPDIGPLVTVMLYPAVKNCRISVPEHRAHESLRPVMTAAVAQKVLAIVGQNPKPRSIHQRSIQKTKDDLRSGDPIRIAEVLRDLYTLNERGYEHLLLVTEAFELLKYELGYVLGVPSADMQTQLADILKSVRLKGVSV